MLPVKKPDDLYTATINTWALGSCGLNSIQRHSYGGKENASFIKEHPDLKGYDACGNFLFSVSSTQLKNPSDLTKELLDHPHCRIIHYYKNNAHGPNMVFICMIHRDITAVDRKDHVNNVEEYRKRLSFTPGKAYWTLTK